MRACEKRINSRDRKQSEQPLQRYRDGYKLHRDLRNAEPEYSTGAGPNDIIEAGLDGFARAVDCKRISRYCSPAQKRRQDGAVLP